MPALHVSGHFLCLNVMSTLQVHFVLSQCGFMVADVIIGLPVISIVPIPSYTARKLNECLYEN